MDAKNYISCLQNLEVSQILKIPEIITVNCFVENKMLKDWATLKVEKEDGRECPGYHITVNKKSCIT